jgi:glycosyltransferase involved in cell wall biosynthesis
MMKSVVIVSTADLYYGNTASAARMNLYARALALAGVDVFLLSSDTLDTKKEWIEVEPHIFSLTKEKIQQGKGYNLFYMLGLILQIRKRVKAIKGDVVMLNYPTTRSLLQDILLLIFCGRFPAFCEVNEVRRFASGSTGSMRDRIYCHILEKTYKYYKGVVFISRNIQAYYASKVRKSVVVPILSDCDQPLVYSKGLDTLDIVFVGTVSFPKENLEELFEGFLLFSKEHPDARLHLYGSITDSNRKRLEEFVSKTNTVETILYHGVIPHDRVREVLSLAGALVLPRTNNKQNYYGFSTKLSEYAVSGSPIILTDTGVVADYFKDKENCLMCDGYNRESFRKKFEELAQMSHAEKQEMVGNAYKVAKKHFNYRMYSDKLTKALFGV